MIIRSADGTEEAYEAGDAFVVPPGHIPVYFAGLEILSFTPAEEANQQLAVIAPNIKKYLEEQGMEVPPQLQATTA